MSALKAMTCPICKGRGSTPGAATSVRLYCWTCEGSGSIWYKPRRAQYDTPTDGSSDVMRSSRRAAAVVDGWSASKQAWAGAVMSVKAGEGK